MVRSSSCGMCTVHPSIFIILPIITDFSLWSAFPSPTTVRRPVAKYCVPPTTRAAVSFEILCRSPIRSVRSPPWSTRVSRRKVSSLQIEKGRPDIDPQGSQVYINVSLLNRVGNEISSGVTIFSTINSTHLHHPHPSLPALVELDKLLKPQPCMAAMRLELTWFPHARSHQNRTSSSSSFSPQS